jgi:hypothetical protein
LSAFPIILLTFSAKYFPPSKAPCSIVFFKSWAFTALSESGLVLILLKKATPLSCVPESLGFVSPNNLQI